MYGRVITLWSLAACALAGDPQGPSVGTVNQAMKQAYETASGTRGAENALQAAYEAHKSAKQHWGPTLNLRTTAGTTFSDQYRTTPGGDPTHGRPQTNTVTASVNLTQNIYNGGATVAGIEKSEGAIEAAKATLSQSETDILLNSANAELSVHGARALLKNAEHNLVFLSKQLEIAAVKFSVGEETVAGFESFKAQKEQAQAALEKARTDLKTAISQYIQTVKRAPPETMEEPQLPQIPASLGEALQFADKNNPRILGLKAQLASAEADVDLKYAALLPTINLNLTGGRTLTGAQQSNYAHLDAREYTRDRQSSFGASVEMTVPLPIMGQQQSDVRQARYVAAQQKFSLRAAHNDTAQQITQAWVEMENSRAQIPSYEAAVQSTAIALASVQEQYALGAATYLDVIQAEQKAVEAQNGLVSSKQAYVSSAYKVLALMGMLNKQSFVSSTVRSAIDNGLWTTEIEDVGTLPVSDEFLKTFTKVQEIG